ncbi:MAG: aminoacyl-tRNA hydrolase [Chloroflexota bacterium]|nr:MAG: aminoacyl-tRNA hydrolase [Chloroflexota bacterium]
MPVSTKWLARKFQRGDAVLDSYRPLKLIVGLGNPGMKYARNRHNVGFMVLAHLARAEHAEFKRQRFNAQLTEIKLDSERVLLVKPQTYMNLSGSAVGKLAVFYRIPRSSVMVVYDDLDLPLGKIRLRANGSSGGHHGMESIINTLGGNDIPRLRIGIGRPDPKQDVGHVLGNFGDDEMSALNEVLERATQALRVWTTQGIVTAMNQFNAL